MSDQVFKADAGKTNPALLEEGCANALAAVQSTLDYGAIKYAAHSWVKVDMQRYNAAARRHRVARDTAWYKQGYDKAVLSTDDESGLPHVAHEIVCLMFQLETALRNMPPKARAKALRFNTPPLNHKGRT